MTGPTGGVGSFSVTLLAQSGYNVVAATGRKGEAAISEPMARTKSSIEPNSKASQGRSPRSGGAPGSTWSEAESSPMSCRRSVTVGPSRLAVSRHR